MKQVYLSMRALPANSSRASIEDSAHVLRTVEWWCVYVVDILRERVTVTQAEVAPQGTP